MSGRNDRRSENNDGSGCIIMAILAVLIMPIVGLYLIVEGDTEGKKTAGIVLIVLWVLFMIYTKYS